MSTELLGVAATLGHLSLEAPHPSQLLLTAPWGATLPSTGEPGLYIVREGSAWIRTRLEKPPLELRADDVALLPRGSAHALSSHPDARTPPIAEFFAEHGGARGVDVRGVGGGGQAAHVNTFCFRVGSANARALLGLVPDLIVLPGPIQRAWVSHVARALSCLLESGERDIRNASVALAEVLFGVAVRTALTRPIAALEGADEATTLALTMIHADLAYPWTVAALARRVGRSKSSFHDRFARWTGRSPMDYVADARMAHAREMLRRSDLSIQEVAEAVGYETASSFAVAFRRRYGATPSETRRAFRRARASNG